MRKGHDTMTRPLKDYAQWDQPVHEWDDVESFVASENLADGVHAIALGDGTVVDLLLIGDPLAASEHAYLLTFFSGAVGDRTETRGPYFSGVGMARRLKMPLVAVADPGLAVDGDLRLAWYAGSLTNNLQDVTAHILRSLSDRAGRPLLMLGGSGGGFAALAQAERLGQRSAAVVWNPQTSILHYNRTSVREYLRTLGFSTTLVNGTTWIEDVATKTGSRIQLSLLGSGRVEDTESVLYLQNRSDWHRKHHLDPWLNHNRWLERAAPGTAEVYARDNRHAVIVADLAEGHAPPSGRVIGDVITRMQTGSATPRGIADSIAENLSKK
ncbi:hypothetical protein BJH93_08870 [Kocuria polaris]|nr:hypothetical protein [Kocuria polaris]